METLAVENLSFYYPESNTPALDNVSFTVKSGEFITVCGASGSGKTTLLRSLKPPLIPQGRRSGKVTLDGTEIETLTHREQSAKIGFVMQSPDNQIVTDKVWHELAFGLESLGFDNQTIRRKVAEAAAFFGLEDCFESDVSTLSGGRKQLLNLASVMAMDPELLILDEPTSMLDPVAAAELLSCLGRINRELGTTVIITEHRPEDIFALSDRIIVMEKGAVISDAAPRETGQNLKKMSSAAFALLPVPMRVWDACGTADGCPVSVAEGRAWLNKYAKNHQLNNVGIKEYHRSEEPAAELKNVYFRYEKDSPDVLKNLSFKAYKGELIGVLGGNGAGKSTLLSVIAGLEKQYGGKVNAYEKTAVLPQAPQTLLSGKTVRDCLLEAFGGKSITPEQQALFDEAVSLCDLGSLLNRHPFDLSGGEMQRTAFARVLLAQPRLLLLDEPTKGMDPEFKSSFFALLSQLCESGVTIIMVSHDVEFCASCCHRCMLLFNGEITASGRPQEFFSENSFYTTSACRMSRGIVENAVTSDDLIYACTGKEPVKNERIMRFDSVKELSTETDRESKPKSFRDRLRSFFIESKTVDVRTENRRLPKRTAAAAFAILVAVPLTIFIGTAFLNNEKTLFISLLVLLECMLPFFLVFEGRKPRARELALIAVMCAAAIAGRSAFIMLPQVKPVLAIVIITGASFGGESGFITGAVTMLVSNIYFGQGAWTPWQMFAAGIIGFIAGVIFQKGLLRANRLTLSAFGFLSALLIYGGIMNFSSLVLSRAPITPASIGAFIAQGLPMDIIHAASTFLFLWFISQPLLDMLRRVKVKYCLY